MPDIFKHQEFVEDGESVQIPDVEVAGLAAAGGVLDPNYALWLERPAGEPPPLTPEELLGIDRLEELLPGAEPPPEVEEPPPPPPPPTKEELAELFADELAELCRDAEERAYSDAIQRKKGELKECIARVDETLGELQREQRQYIEEYSRELKYLAIEIAEKVMLQRIAEDDTNLAALVMRAVTSVKHTHWLSVDLSERLVGLVEHIKGELSKPEYLGRADVNPMACPDDTCRVTTEEGTLVATVTVQTQNLREAFANAEQEQR